MTIELLQKNVLIQIRVEPIAEFPDLKKPSFFLIIPEVVALVSLYLCIKKSYYLCF